MLDANDLLIGIKRASINAIENAKPVNLVFGKVSSISPLNINVENKLKLGKEQLLLSKNLSNYSVEIEIEGEKRQIKIYNALKSGDEVILLRMQGGQKYLILDRVVKWFLNLILKFQIV